MKTNLIRLTAALAAWTAVATSAKAGADTWTSPASSPRGEVILRTAMATGDDPADTGQRAARQLKAAWGGGAPRAVLVMDSFEDLAAKQALLRGVATVWPKEILFGGASYGGFTQSGSGDNDSVMLLGLGGDGLGLAAALVEKMGAAGLTMEKDLDPLTAALNRGGEQLAHKLPALDRGQLLVVISDAHSPKNQLLLDGVQKVAGRKLPITGGSVNKNTGQNWVYFQGAAHTDSAVGLLLTGPFRVAQSGRQAKTNEDVIKTAREGAAAVLKSNPAKPFAVLAFNCGGRKGKLNRLEDELEAVQSSVGKELALFGAYCAGEYGPADLSESQGDVTPCGRGWHVMFTVLAR